MFNEITPSFLRLATHVRVAICGKLPVQMFARQGARKLVLPKVLKYVEAVAIVIYVIEAIELS